MKNSISLSNIKDKLKFCQKYWTVIFGSSLSDNFLLGRSDIDIAIITQNNDKKKNLEIWRSLLNNIPNTYDIKIFELLPLYIQIDIIKTYKVLFGNSLEISEYFYQYRKMWKDMVKRVKSNQFRDIKEKIDLIESRLRMIN